MRGCWAWDEGLLRGAVNRPVNKLAYADPAPDLFDLAAAYAFGLAGNHAFHDGNKRTAWAACVLFLKVNGIELRAAPAEAIIRMIDLAPGALDEPAFAAWLRDNARA